MRNLGCKVIDCDIEMIFDINDRYLHVINRVESQQKVDKRKQWININFSG